jgi:hypothetical protein
VDRRTWIVLSAAVAIVSRGLGRPRRRFEFSDRLIILMWLWAVMHGKPLSWACDRSHYSTLFRPRRLPSVSQFFKRLKTPRLQAARLGLHRVLTSRGREDLLSSIDGKALVIGEYSTDSDARDGIANGRYRKGYKLHARGTQSGFVPEYTVLPLNEGEPNTARTLLEDLPAGALVLADANYDSAPLYRAVRAKNAHLLTRLKGKPSSRPEMLRKMGEGRPEAILAWRTQRLLCERVMHRRDHIERIFAHLSSSGTGLGPLPAWVRRLSRVRLWVDGKLAVYHARLIARLALAGS